MFFWGEGVLLFRRLWEGQFGVGHFFQEVSWPWVTKRPFVGFQCDFEGEQDSIGL